MTRTAYTSVALYVLLLTALGLGVGAGAAAAPAVGSVSPAREVALHPQVDGLLREVRVAEGQRVAAGEVLAVVDDRAQRARTDAARLRASTTAGVDKARVALTQAADRLTRTRAAHDQQAAETWELEQAVAAHDVAAADLALAEQAHELAVAELAAAEALLDQHTLRAPFDAVVLAVHADAGATVSRGGAVVELADLAELEAEAFVPAAWLASVEPGQAVTLRAESPVGRTLAGTVTHLDPRITPGSGKVRCTVSIDNADLTLPSGFQVTLAPTTPSAVAAN